MRSAFQHYLKSDQESIKKVWHDENSLFVFDTNVLLNLYRYSRSTSNKFLEVLETLKERIWIPHQVGLEYFRNRCDVISDQKENYSKFLKDIDKLVKDIESANCNPFFSKELTEKIISVKSDVQSEVENIQEEYEKQLNDDHLKEKILTIFEGKVGAEYPQDRKNEIYKEGEKRYKEKLPPGFCDEKKPAPHKYGDLIIWHQILDCSIESKSNIIFVLDDGKEDWWWSHKGRTISAHPDLIREFREKTSNKILFYRPFMFLEHFNEFRNQLVAREAIEEVKNYVVDSLSSNPSNRFEIRVKGDSNNALEFCQFVRDSGYQISVDSNDDMHLFKIVLPNIPDLERRFYSRYVTQLGSFSLELLGYN